MSEEEAIKESCHRCETVAELGKDKLCQDCRDGKTILCKQCGKPRKVVPETGLCSRCHAEKLREDMFGEKPPLSAGKVRKKSGGKRKAPEKRSEAVKKAKCARCGEKRSLVSRGLCGSCYTTCRRLGLLEDFPKIPRGRQGAADALTKTLKAYGVAQKPILEKIDLHARIAEIQECIAKECEDLVKCLLEMAALREDQAVALRAKADKCSEIIKRMREKAL